MNWDDLRIFAALADAGSLNAAAKQLRVDPTTVSRRMTALERQLGSTLIDRNASSWLLTSAGKAVLRSVDEMNKHAEAVTRTAFAESGEFQGELIISSGGEFLKQFLSPIIWSFCRVYPEISIKLISTSAFLPVNRRDADIVFRATKTPPNDAVAKRVGIVDYYLYGSKSLLDRVDLENAPTIVWSFGGKKPSSTWINNYVPNTPITHTFNDEGLVLDAVKNDLGVALLPLPLAETQNDLVRLGPEEPVMSTDIWMAYHTDVRKTKKLRAFCDYAVEGLQQNFSAFPK